MPVSSEALSWPGSGQRVHWTLSAISYSFNRPSKKKAANVRNLHIPTNLERSWKIYHRLKTQQVNKAGAQPSAVLTSPAANAKRESGGLQGSPALTGNTWCWGWTAATDTSCLQIPSDCSLLYFLLPSLLQVACYLATRRNNTNNNVE